MSPLFGAVFLWLLAAILWWSGWREDSTEGFPHWGVGVFLSLWPMAVLINIPLTSSIAVNGAWIWTTVFVLVLSWRLPPSRRGTSISAGMLVGSVYVLLNRLAFYPSGFSHYFAPWGTAILLGLISSLLLRNVWEQVLTLSVGLYLSAGIGMLFQTSLGGVPVLRGAEWVEGWWIALLSARLWSAAVRTLANTGRRWAFKMGEKRGGQRS
ncbi:hypothetical protein [Cohnella luojiensis]|uniref:Uncharacterized protein n=1 Tax=Cohnella luojiensis TaxID=652876 RepID=A0A4Y8M3F5_9BACL|nr:hypothetical protein [Cohnella luojiensis]TFE29971.1 hypothetical protein E2980_04230 [Cohnella luojiensis]